MRIAVPSPSSERRHYPWEVTGIEYGRAVP